MTLTTIIDWILYIALGLPAIYLFIFALLSTMRCRNDFTPARRQHRFITLIPAYKGDAVILDTVRAALAQEYPRELHEVVVIADQMHPHTLAELRKLPIRLLEVQFENSSKAKALNYAVEALGADAAEMVAILDVDNIAPTEFISSLNTAYDAGVKAIQAHRTARNRNTDTAVLDAASEEMNNSIFRRGHINLGISSALIGSGMAFDYAWFRENIALCTTAGEDKELEVLLLRQGIYIDYLDQVKVLDEKVQQQGAYYNQRRRWIAAQLHTLIMALRDMPGAVLSGNIDYCDKLLQWCMPPRILLMGLIPTCAVVISFVEPLAAIKWWAALLLLAFALAFALPDEQMDDRLRRALRRLPVIFVLTAANLFRLRGASKNFIHTQHTETKPEQNPQP